MTPWSNEVRRPRRILIASDWVREHRVQFALSLRVTVAAVLTLALSQLFHTPLVLWTVLTAVIVTQMSVGRSLKATIDYMVGTVGGAIYSGVVAVLVPHTGEIGLLVALAVAIAPLAMVAAINPSFNVAPFTAVLVLLAPTIIHVSPVESAFDRVLEVALGAVIGLGVSYLVFPARAHRLAIAAAARLLEMMARAPPPRDPVDAALAGYAAEMAALCREGLTRTLRADEVERVFVLGFALEEMHQHFKDLDRSVREYAAPLA